MAKVSKFIVWTPRVLSILFIIFLGLMSLDVFDENIGFWGAALGLFIHNIPAIILSIVLIISWKHEIVGGIIFILSGLLYILFAIIRAETWQIALLWILQISGIAFLIGILFLIGWRKKQQGKRIRL